MGRLEFVSMVGHVNSYPNGETKNSSGNYKSDTKIHYDFLMYKIYTKVYNTCRCIVTLIPNVLMRIAIQRVEGASIDDTAATWSSAPASNQHP